jgi:capsid protein
MSANLPTHYVKQWANTIELLAQQKQSKLQMTVDSGSNHYGEQASPVDQFGQLEATENTERFAPMPRTDLPTDRRWIIPRNWDVNQVIDKNDLMRMLNDPKSKEAEAAVAALNRRKDTTILQGLGGVNLTGKDGTTQTSLPATQVVGVSTGGTASNLNVAKIRAAKRILMGNDVDVLGEELYFVVNAAAHDSLLAEVQASSKDYNEARDGKPILVEGIISRFMGFNFVHCERVETGTDDQAGTSSSCFAYAKSGVYLGTWKDIATDIRERGDLRAIPYQIYTAMTLGATRKDEKKVVRVWTR